MGRKTEEGSDWLHVWHSDGEALLIREFSLMSVTCPNRHRAALNLRPQGPRCERGSPDRLPHAMHTRPPEEPCRQYWTEQVEGRDFFECWLPRRRLLAFVY